MSASQQSRPRLVAAVLPIAAAVGVFGIVYGAAAQPLFGGPLTVASSVIIFSGAAQFTMVGLLAAGASPLAVLWAVTVLDLRHLALGAAIRPRLTDGPVRRLATAWFVIDETVGLALTSGRTTSKVLAGAGGACYLAWIAGTAIGVAGGAVVGVEALAAAVFPVLFIGLASILAPDRRGVMAAAVAGSLTVARAHRVAGPRRPGPRRRRRRRRRPGRPAVIEIAVVATAAILTYASRAAAVVLLPVAGGRLLRFIERLPAPLFAGLAVFALVGATPTWPDLPAACAAGGALAVAWRRNVALTLAAGLFAFGIGTLLT